MTDQITRCTPGTALAEMLDAYQRDERGLPTYPELRALCDTPSAPAFEAATLIGATQLMVDLARTIDAHGSTLMVSQAAAVLDSLRTLPLADTDVTAGMLKVVQGELAHKEAECVKLAELLTEARAAGLVAPSVDRNAVLDGWTIGNASNGQITVQKEGVGGYLAKRDSSSIASSILYELACSVRYTAPAAQVPVPELAPSGAVPIGYISQTALTELQDPDAPDNLLTLRHSKTQHPKADIPVYLAAQPIAASAVPELSNDQVRAAARALADRSADSCNVNREDNWHIYYSEFMDDASLAFKSAGFTVLPAQAAPSQQPAASPTEAK